MNETIYFIADLHIPYENKKKVNSVLEDIQNNQPDKIVLGGDMIDFYQISKFDKDPERIGKLQQELDKFYSFMRQLRSVYTGPIKYIIGNHETRLEKYLIRNPGFYGLKILSLNNLLKADEFNVDVVYEYMYRKFLFTHGHRTSKYSAARELDDNGISGITGHVHRHQTYCKTDRRGQICWISAPCLIDETKQDYTSNPNWGYGYVALSFNSQRMTSYEVRFK